MIFSFSAALKKNHLILLRAPQVRDSLSANISIIAVEASLVDIAPAAAHTVVMVAEPVVDTDAAFHPPDTFLQAVVGADIPADKPDRAAPVLEVAEVVDSIVAAD